MNPSLNHNYVTLSCPEVNKKPVLRYWHLMTMATCVMFPPDPVIFNYLTLHLKRHAMEGNSEAGQYALFCIKVHLHRHYIHVMTWRCEMSRMRNIASMRRHGFAWCSLLLSIWIVIFAESVQNPRGWRQTVFAVIQGNQFCNQKVWWRNCSDLKLHTLTMFM